MGVVATWYQRFLSSSQRKLTREAAATSHEVTRAEFHLKKKKKERSVGPG